MYSNDASTPEEREQLCIHSTDHGTDLQRRSMLVRLVIASDHPVHEPFRARIIFLEDRCGVRLKVTEAKPRERVKPACTRRSSLRTRQSVTDVNESDPENQLSGYTRLTNSARVPSASFPGKRLQVPCSPMLPRYLWDIGGRCVGTSRTSCQRLGRSLQHTDCLHRWCA